MKKRHIYLLLIILVMLSSLMMGCEDNAEATVRVMVSCSEGVKVVGQNPIDVKPGSAAEFDLEIAPNYVLNTPNIGKLIDNKLRIENVTRRTTVNLIAENVGYDTTEEVKFYFSAGNRDTSTLPHQSSVRVGTSVTVSANEKYKAFAGWSLGNHTTDRSKMISFDRTFTFRIRPDYANLRGIVKICANYVDSNYFYYNANGGTVDYTSGNTASNDFYNVTNDGGKLKITMSQKYLSVFEAVSLFYDDNTFTREGYVLAEYNTKPDGSGTGYSLGSKYFVNPESEGGNELYCIWKKASEGLTYANLTIPKPNNNIPDTLWQGEGIVITGYEGDESEVVIPEELDGKRVIAIGAGAFRNKHLATLVLPKTLLRVYDGAFVGCSSLSKIYYPDSIYDITDNALDADSYTSLKSIYVNAAMAPRYSNSEAGYFSLKLSRILASENEKRIIVIAGSSTYQGLSSEYMEALLDNYRVINFGTTRTTNGLIYLEGMRALTNKRDVVIYAPENSTYMMGERELYWKTLRDLECMNNFYRYIDISNFEGFFGASSDFNKNYRYTKAARRYEDAIVRVEEGYVNKYGELISRKTTAYIDSYFITMNDMYKTKFEGDWSNENNQEANKDYTDPDNITWGSILESDRRLAVNAAIEAAKSAGAKVYFSFCPVDADKIFPEFQNKAALAAYDKMILDNFIFDGLVGESKNYVFHHDYFYDCAFHLNDTGRALRSYRMYLDLAAKLGFSPKGYSSAGTSFGGCSFEEGNAVGMPIKEVAYTK